MKQSVYNYHGEMFKGCIRSLHLSTSTEIRNINLPEDLPGFLYGLCHTSLMVVGVSQQETLYPGFVLLGTRQQEVPGAS
ncbi:unnamed protein product [Schistosoma mattheei]|uniref:Uncharacterized protein n=1 Tax=Schistosoma mattheei TaxID=31246 RepID=A0A183Q467_9TREM|nr:unnamed protein product [Schistosoma mattheei]